MATRTLGIKFQVKGFEKASKSLSKLEVGIKKSAKANEELRRSQVKTNQEISKTKTQSKSNASFSASVKEETNNVQSNQRIVYAGTDTEAVNQAQAELIGQSVAAAINANNDELFDRWANALQDFKKGNVLGGLFQLVKKPIESVASGYYEAIGGEFGSKVVQRLMGVKDPVSSGFKGRGTDVKSRDSLSSSLFRGGFTVNVNLTSENIKDLSNGLKRVVNSSNGLTLNVVNKDKDKKKGNIFTQMVGSITTKFDAISSGYYEGIGNLFGTQFATGLSQTLEEEIDYSQERKGKVAGKTIGFVVNDGLGNLNDKFDTLKFTIADLNTRTGSLDLNKVSKFVTALVGIPNSLLDSTMTGFRRASVKEEATRKVDARKANFNEEIENIQDLEQVVITASGFAGEGGTQGRVQAEKLREINQDDKTAVISSDTSFTDVMFQATDLASGAAWGVNAVANAAKINLKGFNPDSVEMVNKVLALREQNPEIQIKLVGHSAGGFVVEEAQYLLEQLEVGNVEAVTAGTPNLKGNLKPENIRRIFAEQDPLNALHQAGALVDFVNDDTEFDSVPGGHFFDEYIRSEDVREAIFGRSDNGQSDQRRYDGPPPNNNQPDGGQGGDTPPNNDQPDGGGNPPNSNRPDGDTPPDLEIDQSPLEQIRANFETYINLINDTVQELQQRIANILNPANLAADVRAARLTTEGQADLNRRLDRDDYDDIQVREGTENIVAVIGGYTGMQGKSGQQFANKIGGIVQDDTTQYVGLTNEFTDVVQPNDAFKDMAGKVTGMFAEVHRLGYNPDSTKAAAEIIKLQEANPDLNIKIAGYSGGGYVAEDIIRLLQDYGANMDNIEVMGVGTPDLPGGVDTEGFNRILGESDPVLNIDQLKNLNQQIKDLLGFYLIPELTTELQNIEGIDTHSIDQYLFFSEEFQRFLYGDTEKVQRLKNIYEELNGARSSASYNAGLIERVEQNEEILDPEEKAELLGRLRENQIEALKRVSNLSGQAKEVGGGRFFTRHGKKADRELEKLGVQYGTRRVTEEEQNQEPPETQPELTLDQYVAEYQQYLDNLMQEAEEKAEDLVLAFIPNYNELDIEGRKAYFRAIRKDVEELATFYRESLEAGDINLAREIGEELLKEIQAVKRIYRDLRAAGITDRSLVGNLAQTTSIENEIRRGQPNLRGRATIGLEAHFANNLETFLASQLNDAEEAGDQVAQGFIQGILEDLAAVREAGQAIADETIDATEENLDIQSPSRVFRRIGRYVVEGFNLGLTESDLEGLEDLQNRFNEVDFDSRLLGDDAPRELLARREQLEQELHELVNSIETNPEEILAGAIREQIRERTGELRTVLTDLVEVLDEANQDLSEEVADINDQSSTNGNWLNQLVNQFTTQINTLASSNPIISSITSTLSPLVGLFLGGLGIKATLGLIKSLSEEFVETAIAAETLEKAIVYSSRNIEEGLSNLKYVTTAALDLDIDVSLAQRNYSSLIGAAKDTILEGFQTEDLFEAFATTASNRGLSTESQDRLFTAISQIVGKRKLTAEEVRGQIGDISGFGDFIGLVGQAQGVSTPQLEDMMSRGQLRLDVLPKVAALLNAKNLMNSMEVSTASLQVRVNNASNSFKVAVGKIFLPLKRLELRVKSVVFREAAEHAETLAKVILNVLLVVILALAKNVTITTLAMKAFMFVVNGVQGAILKLWGVRAILLQALGAWLLIAVAIKAANNAFQVAGNPYKETEKDIEKLKLGINALTEAWNAANKAQAEYINTDLPQKSTELRIADGFELPDNWFGAIAKPIAGGDNLNLDNLVRRRLQGLEILGKTAIRDLAGNLGLKGIESRYNRRLDNTNFKTLAEKRENDLVISISDFGAVANQTLMDVSKATEAAEKINDYDNQIREIQSQRLLLLPGDEKALKESLAAEREIQKKRNEQLKILSQEKENIQLVIATSKKKLQEVEELKLTGGITESRAESQIQFLNSLLADSETALEGINEELAKLPKQLSEFSRRLQISEEKTQGFLENRDRATQEGRINIIREGIESVTGEQVVQLQLTQLENEDLNDRIEHLTGSINAIQKDLQSPQLATGIKRIEAAAAEKGVELTTATLTNFLEKEDRDPQEQEALRALLNIRQDEAQILQFREQLAQNIKQSRTDLKEMNRTINDYFFNLQQKIKEAQIETERLVNQIFFQDIKSQLRRAISPGSESFVNGIIEGVQSLFDQVQQIFEQSLGLKSSRLQFESEAYSNEQGMRDFIKQVRGATDALGDFRNRLNGNANVGNNQVTNNNAVNFPLPGLTLDEATITSGFGQRIIFGRRDSHEGIDIAVPGGTDVLAVRDGVIRHIKPLADQMQVAVESVNESGQTVTEWFIHLSDNLLVGVGDRVSSGQKIGEVAFTTARARKEKVSTGDHLDYRVKVDGQWVNPKTMLNNASQGQIIIDQSNSSENVSRQNSSSSRSDDLAQRAISGNQEFNTEELRQLDLQEILGGFGIEDLDTAIANEKEKIRRQFQIETIQKDNRLADLLDKVANLQSQSVRSNADIEVQREIRAAAAEFRNLEFEGLQQTQALSDELATIEGVLKIFPDAISQIQATGDAQAQAILPVLNQILTEAENTLPKVKAQLEETVEVYKAIAEEKEKTVAFIKEQGILKKRIAELTETEELQQLKSNIAARRGTNEQRRQNELIAERLRLSKRIDDIKLNTPDDEHRKELIELEKRSSAIAEEEINREADNRDLSYEQELLNINSGIDGKKAELIRGDGFELEANRIQRENAIAQEDLRYDQEIARLEKEYAGEPEKLAALKRQADLLNQVNLVGIQNQFKDLKGTIRDVGLKEFQNFFSEVVKDVDNVGQLLLNLVGNFARSIADMFARQAASSVFSFIFKTAVSSLSEGGTIENFEEGGTVDRVVPTPISDRLQQISAPIRNAFRREGSGGRLAVFTPGEEVLSIKTGEAGRYQGLKQALGVNPLEKIFSGNFMDGGTIEANLLAGLDYSIPKINVSAIGERDRSQPNTTQVYNLSSTFVTPEIDSFKASEYQIQQEQLEYLRRMNGRA